MLYGKCAGRDEYPLDDDADGTGGNGHKGELHTESLCSNAKNIYGTEGTQKIDESSDNLSTDEGKVEREGAVF